MTNGVNGDNFFNNLSVDFSKLYKEKDVELTKSDLQNIFDSAIKNDKDGKISAQEFLKAAESFDAEKFGNLSFLEKSKEFEEFSEAFNDIGMLDGTDGLSSADMKKLFEGDKKLPESVFKENPKLKTEDNKNYVEVEDYNSRKSDNNDCLTKIIRNNYDLDALGIKVGTKEYELVEKAVMDANEKIYGTDDNPGRKRIQDGQRHSSILYTGDKVVLPDLYEIKELQEAGIKRPEKEQEPEPTPAKNSLEDLYGKLVDDKNGKQTYVKGAKVTTIEKTPDGEKRTTVDNTSSSVQNTITEVFDKNGTKVSTDKISEDKQHHSTTTVAQKYDKNGIITSSETETADMYNNKTTTSETYESGKLSEKIVISTDSNNRINSRDIYNYSEHTGNTSDPTETTIHSHFDYKTGDESKETTTKHFVSGEKNVTFKKSGFLSETTYDSAGKVKNAFIREEKEDGTYITTKSGDHEVTRHIPKEKSESHEAD